MKIDDLIRLFMDTRRRGTGGAKKRGSAKTLEYYERNLTIFRDELLKLDRPIVDYDRMTKYDVIAVFDVVEEHRRSGKWKQATMSQFYRVIKTFFRWIEYEKKQPEPDEDFRELKTFLREIPVIEKNPQRDFVPAVTDLRTFKNSFKSHQSYGFRDYVAFTLMLDTGIRSGELCNLRLADLMLHDKRMIVEGKTGRRLVPLTSSVIKILAAWLKRRESMRMGRQSEYVFVSKRKPQLNPDAVRKIFERVRRDNNEVVHITAHTLRHSFATYYLKNGGNMERLRNITGHKSYEMLKHYLHMAQVTGEESMEELERVAPSSKM